MMSYRQFLFILSGLLAYGGLYQLGLAQAPTKTPPAASSGSALKDDGREWIKPPPEGLFPEEGTQDVEEAAIYEVVASKKDVAIDRDLRGQNHVKLTHDVAVYYTGHYFRCPRGKAPYLVRAVFGHGGTGRYYVRRFGRKLLVEHGSLGRSDAANKSALVVNLDFEPEALYTLVRIAE
ncbi:hypothetical protein V5E97_14580 [Singulisphaera sp. Ch08]|uniref:Uncharacterized protein n=1 Tax=Singulisphaera sp. Ch08 TaxID=3120278 RepID=A0AAU7CQK8_9BACT